MTLPSLSENCGPGNYIDGSNNYECTPCPKGQYQDEKWQTQCKKCPKNALTLSPGATSVTECSCKYNNKQFDSNSRYYAPNIS